MILKTNYINNTKEVYITLVSEGLPGVGWFCVFDAQDFYNRYYASGEPGGSLRCHEDIIDTYCNIVASVPYSKEELMENTYLRIDSNFMNYIEL